MPTSTRQRGDLLQETNKVKWRSDETPAQRPVRRATGIWWLFTDNETPLRPPGLASGCGGRTAQTAIQSVRHYTILGPKDLTSLSFMTMVSEPGSRFMSLVVSIRMAMPSPR